MSNVQITVRMLEGETCTDVLGTKMYADSIERETAETIVDMFNENDSNFAPDIMRQAYYFYLTVETAFNGYVYQIPAILSYTFCAKTKEATMLLGDGYSLAVSVQMIE